MLAGLPGARVYPSSANLVLVRLPSSEHARSLVAHLERADVLVKDVSGAPGLAGCVRVTVGTTEELDALERELAGWQP
jgi:histidinol-phosphate aminotransferase